MQAFLSSRLMLFLGRASYGVYKYLGHVVTLQMPGLFALETKLTNENYNHLVLTVKAIQWYAITLLMVVQRLSRTLGNREHFH